MDAQSSILEHWGRGLQRWVLRERGGQDGSGRRVCGKPSSRSRGQQWVLLWDQTPERRRRRAVPEIVIRTISLGRKLVSGAEGKQPACRKGSG